MEVKYNLNKMDSFLLEMMKADINKYRFELIISAKKVLKRLEKKGYLSKTVNLAKSIKMHKDTMEFKAKEIINDIDNIIRFDAEMTGDTTASLTIWINPDYFLNTDVIKSTIGSRASKVMKIVTRQKMIDDFEKAIMDDYTRDFTGEIIESDGDSFSVQQ